MRFTAAVACSLVGSNCCDMAAGTVAQNLIAHDAIAVWYFIAALWFVSAVRIAFWGCE